MNEITLSEYSQMTGISEEALTGRLREKPLSTARQIHWLYLKCFGCSYDKIALLYGRRRPTIINGVKTIKNLIETKDALIVPYLDFVNSFSRQEKTI